MALPERDTAMGWVGKTVVDRDGAEIGACTAVIGDDSSGLAEWVCADLGGVNVFVPAVDAVESGERVRVTVTRADALSAQSFGGAGRLSDDEEAALYRHYRIPHPRAASETLLPAGEAAPSAVGVPPNASAATPPPAGTPTESGDGMRWSAPEADKASEETGDLGPAARRDRLVLVSGVLAGLGAIVGALLALRRRRNRRPPTPTEQLVRLARAWSVAVTERTMQLGGSAALVAAAGGRAAERAGQRAASGAARLAAAAASSMAETGMRGRQRVGEAVGSVPEVVAERSQRLRQRWWAVMSKLTMAAAFGVGYVLGARAGRQRFEQLKQAADRVRQRPQVQRAAEKFKSAAGEKLQTGTGRVTQRTAGFTEKLRRRRESMGTGSDEQTSPYPPTGPGRAGEPPSAPGVTQEPWGSPDPSAGDPEARPLE